MKRRAAVAAIGIMTALAAVGPAPAAVAKDIYMVKNVQPTGDGFYVGEFVVLRKAGTQVVGARGAFYSEYGCLRGTVANGLMQVQTWDDLGNLAGTWTKPWVNGHVKGWQPVTWTKFMKYSGGFKPGKAINYCVSTT